MKRPLLFLIMCSLFVFLYGCTFGNEALKIAQPNESALSKIETNNKEGTVTLLSGNEELTPFKSWAHGSHPDKDGNIVAADALQLAERGVESELQSIIYADDFEVKIDGSPNHVSYMTYTDNFGAYEGSSFLSDKLVIPKEKGDYIIRIQVSWDGSKDNYDAYDYVFKLVIE